MALVGLPYASNYVRGLAWAKKHSAMVIDDTTLGRFLNNFDGTGLFSYFRETRSSQNRLMRKQQP